MTLQSVIHALIGGVLIGSSVSLMLLGLGRIAGISGLFGSLITGRYTAVALWFITGLLAAPWVASLLGFWSRPDYLANPAWPKLLFAGLLVGIGTQLGSGCTSGHGICGMANLSQRSVTATMIFMGVAALVVALGFGGVA
ncbi:YeeE/YedE family protein [Hydrocarboniphaga sp.]|uniref:YeeE/YedE family protein n=1 Tax=Hydrocarboniphaga sp. TaxID=2033016 RepID=UPI003D10D236